MRNAKSQCGNFGVNNCHNGKVSNKVVSTYASIEMNGTAEEKEEGILSRCSAWFDL